MLKVYEFKDYDSREELGQTTQNKNFVLLNKKILALFY